MEQKEFALENQCRLYARSKGWLVWKNEKNGNKGIPDDSLYHPILKRFIFVEFKKDNKQHLRHEQQIWFNRCADCCFLIADFDSFKKLIDTSTTYIHNY